MCCRRVQNSKSLHASRVSTGSLLYANTRRGHAINATFILRQRNEECEMVRTPPCHIHEEGRTRELCTSLGLAYKSYLVPSIMHHTTRIAWSYHQWNVLSRRIQILVLCRQTLFILIRSSRCLQHNLSSNTGKHIGHHNIVLRLASRIVLCYGNEHCWIPRRF